jgi:acetyl-CoA carboxylase biotin carboxyl carrier protein
MSKSIRAKSATKKRQTPLATNKAPAHAPDMKTVRDLIDFIANTGLNEVNIETADLKLHIKREPDQRIIESAAPAVSAAKASAISTDTAKGSLSPDRETPESSTPAGKPSAEIKSPMIGTFYRSPNPDTPPFVSVGDRITKGQTVCIIEAMKLFNEIESEVSGTIVKALVENSTPVEYDQPLFVVELD